MLLTGNIVDMLCRKYKTLMNATKTNYVVFGGRTLKKEVNVKMQNVV